MEVDDPVQVLGRGDSSDWNCSSARSSILRKIRISAVKRLALVSFMVVVAACGGGDDDTTERPLTAREASLLASTLYLNHLEGRAAFEVHTVVSDRGASLVMKGLVDWTAGSGLAEVSADVEGSTLTSIVWANDIIAERRPVVDDILASRGLQHPIFVIRQASPGRRLDNVIQVVSSLASSNPENQLLIRQTEGSAFLRNDELRNRPVVVLRYGIRSMFWIDSATGALLRFEGNDRTGELPIVVDFLPSRGGVVSFPPATNTIAIEQVPELVPLISEF